MKIRAMRARRRSWVYSSVSSGRSKVALEHDLPLLASFPEYWGDELRIAPGELRGLLSELHRMESLEVSAEMTSAAEKLRRVLRVALSEGQALNGAQPHPQAGERAGPP